jgi:hypothetical protein
MEGNKAVWVNYARDLLSVSMLPRFVFVSLDIRPRSNAEEFDMGVLVIVTINNIAIVEIIKVDLYISSLLTL